MFSKTFRYGLRAAVLLAVRREEGYLKVHELSAMLDVPQSVLAKTLHTLGSAGVVETLRGPNGGCRWNPAADDLTLTDLVRILDGKLPETTCLLGLDHFGDAERCVLPEFSAKRIITAMSRVSLREVADKCADTHPNYR